MMILSPPALKTGVRFTERLTGHFSERNLADFASAERQGRTDGSTIELRLHLAADDLDRFLADEDSTARVTGTVLAPTLSAAPMPIRDGTLQVHPAQSQAAAREMRYRLTACSQEGGNYFLRGDKFIHGHSVLHVWPETTTLYLSVHEGSSAAAPPLGRGSVHVSPHDFARHCHSMEITRAAEEGARLAALARVGRFLSGDLFDLYGPVVAGPYPFRPDAAPRRKRPLRVAAPEVHYFPTADGLALKLTRYRGGAGGPVLLIPGLGVSSRLFALDTVETNLLEFLSGHGYDVWLLDSRLSIDLPYAEQPCTADDVARLDLPAAVAEVRWKTGAPRMACVADGLGATAFVLAMLTGMKGVRSAVLLQNAAHFAAPARVHAAAGAHQPEILERILATHRDGEPWHERLEELLVGAYPVIVGLGDTNPVSRRLALLYGPLFEVGQLNAPTYWEALHELFGRTNLPCVAHLSTMARAGHVVDANGCDVYRLHARRLALPLLLLHGEKNRCWLPEGTRQTYDWLCRENGAALFRHQVIADYGHLDCLIGRNAARDVYPLILAHLEGTSG